MNSDLLEKWKHFIQVQLFIRPYGPWSEQGTVRHNPFMITPEICLYCQSKPLVSLFKLRIRGLPQDCCLNSTPICSKVMLQCHPKTVGKTFVMVFWDCNYVKILYEAPSNAGPNISFFQGTNTAVDDEFWSALEAHYQPAFSARLCHSFPNHKCLQLLLICHGDLPLSCWTLICIKTTFPSPKWMTNVCM